MKLELDDIERALLKNAVVSKLIYYEMMNSKLFRHEVARLNLLYCKLDETKGVIK